MTRLTQSFCIYGDGAAFRRAAAPLEEMDANNNANNKSPSKWFSGFRGGNTASKERMFQELLDRKIKASEEFRLGVSLLRRVSRRAKKSFTISKGDHPRGFTCTREVVARVRFPRCEILSSQVDVR